MGRIMVIGGGARSGKSRFALHKATHLGSKPLFIATALAFDDEMRARIARHKAERDVRFDVREEPRNLVHALQAHDSHDVVVVDCLTLWLSNLLVEGQSETQIEVAVDQLVEALRESDPHVILVTNEVGLGIVPEHPLGRLFRDVAGRTHQRLAVMADEVYFGAMGCMLHLKPGPVTAVDLGQQEELT
ncbi:MAG: bifunctional adenosylcobinamide kinase/adenosylcobinamide-phosphate guanylyltransferase [Myxococcota bacterium]